MIALAGGLAFGLGGKDFIREMLEEMRKKENNIFIHGISFFCFRISKRIIAMVRERTIKNFSNKTSIRTHQNIVKWSTVDGRKKKPSHVFCFFRPKSKALDNHRNNRKNAPYILDSKTPARRNNTTKHRESYYYQPKYHFLSGKRQTSYCWNNIHKRSSPSTKECIVNRKRKAAISRKKA